MQDVGSVRGAGDEEPVAKEMFGMKPGFGDRFGGVCFAAVCGGTA